MFYTFQDILDSLYTTHNADGDSDKEAEVARETRKAYYEMSTEASWEALRDSVEYDFDENEDGMWLPANIAGVDAVGNDEYEWVKATALGAQKDDIQSRMWFISERSTAVLLSGSDITITSGSTSFTGGTGITEDMVGEYIRFDGQSGVHKLTSTTTIEDAYYGDDLSGDGTFEVRPIGTQKIKLVAPQGETDETAATIYFWKLPAQLYDGSQLIMLPTSALLELASSIKLYGIGREFDAQDRVKKDLYGSKGRYEGELQRAKAQNPEFTMPIKPRTVGGLPAGYGARRRNSTYGRIV